jgi:hypothetical protein
VGVPMCGRLLVGVCPKTRPRIRSPPQQGPGGSNVGQAPPHGPAAGPAALKPPLLLGQCKTRSTALFGWPDEVSGRWNQQVGWDAAVKNQESHRGGKRTIYRSDSDRSEGGGAAQRVWGSPRVLRRASGARCGRSPSCLGSWPGRDVPFRTAGCRPLA